MPQSARRVRAVAPEPPAGFRYWPELLDASAESRLLGEIAEMPFEPFLFRGFAARRRVVHFGWGYDFDVGGLTPGPPIPSVLLALREQVAPLGEAPPEGYEEVLVTEYQPGATIGWHRDAPAFGPTVIGVSLSSACRMRFRRKVGDGWENWEQTLDRRSAYLLSGAARSSWQHSIPPTPELRYSITYRTIHERHRPHS